MILTVGLADAYRAVARLKNDGSAVRFVAPIHATNLRLLTDLGQHKAVVDLCVGGEPASDGVSSRLA